MKKAPLKQRIMALTVIIAIVVISVAVFVVVPSIKKIITLQKQISETQQFLENRYLTVRQLKKSLSELDEIHKNTEKYQTSYIDVGQELNIITELEKLAQFHGIEQNLNISDNTSEKDPETGLPYYTFSFLNHGNFENHIKYLNSLESLPYYIKIDSLLWERGSGEEDKKLPTTLRFNGNIYANPS
jgi:type II secretory pathway pseudopilin PulG